VFWEGKGRLKSLSSRPGSIALVLKENQVAERGSERGMKIRPRK